MNEGQKRTRKEDNGCPYAGNIFTVKNSLQCTRVFYIKKTVSLPFSCSVFLFSLTLALKFHSFFFS
jgi:hypothetical protein